MNTEGKLEKRSLVCAMEELDDTLREMCVSLQLMRAGTEGLANGDILADALSYVCEGLQNARATLDAAAGGIV